METSIRAVNSSWIRAILMTDHAVGLLRFVNPSFCQGILSVAEVDSSAKVLNCHSISVIDSNVRLCSDPARASDSNHVLRRKILPVAGVVACPVIGPAAHLGSFLSATIWSLEDSIIESFRSALALGSFLSLDEEFVEVMRWVEGTGQFSLLGVAGGRPEEEVKSAGGQKILMSAGLVSGRGHTVRRTKDCDRNFIGRQIAREGSANGGKPLSPCLDA
ncbi:hypothetical protein N0V93_000482 [Gnomoniopsis smithogilvyi]|uniref:Uncharacterized protein n=1 Tax=Gnomoniopsis smithogilvyi TaxID=1191159 RepID=A0A9W8Z202_9PEZI|nr:hypothetical protein N0V93_000482 [Gnomoniopsis smithogilvyi]